MDSQNLELDNHCFEVEGRSLGKDKFHLVLEIEGIGTEDRKFGEVAVFPLSMKDNWLGEDSCCSHNYLEDNSLEVEDNFLHSSHHHRHCPSNVALFHLKSSELFPDQSEM